MIQQTVIVRSRLGLHARAAARLVRVATAFQSSFQIERTDNANSADGKSILSILMLAATQGTELRITANGADEEAAMNALRELFLDGFGELTADEVA